MYICTNICPHFAEPCEMDDFDYERNAMIHAPCPIGEDDWFRLVDKENLFMCLVVGSRSFTDYNLFFTHMERILSSKQNKTIVILSGGADGADSLAERYAREKGYIFLCMPADWISGKERASKTGSKNQAGYERNVKMHEYLAKHEDRGCVAFWDRKSKGTTHSFSLAKKYETQLRVVRV